MVKSAMLQLNWRHLVGALSMIAFLIVLGVLIAENNGPSIPPPPVRTAADFKPPIPPVKTELYDAGQEITCVRVYQGDETLRVECFR